jgi:hypothetical protein
MRTLAPKLVLLKPNTVRLGRDYHVRLYSTDYTVDPTLIGRMVEVTADLDRVQVRAGGRLVAEHARLWARGMTITNPAHVEMAKRSRTQFQQPGPISVVDELFRDLGDYDRAFGSLPDSEAR